MSALAQFSPVAMSTLEIATLGNRRHGDVVRDAKVMIVELYGEDIIDAIIPDSQLSRRAAFVREHADDVLNRLEKDDASWRHLSAGVQIARDARGYVANISLDKSHTITLISGYDVRVRKRIIDRWMYLEDAARIEASVQDAKPIQPIRETVLALVREEVAAQLKPVLDYLSTVHAKPAARPKYPSDRRYLPSPKREGSTQERVALLIRRSGEVTQSEISRSLWPVKTIEISTALRHLTLVGIVSHSIGPAPRRGRPATTWRWIGAAA